MLSSFSVLVFKAPELRACSLTSDQTDLVSLCASQRVLCPDFRGSAVIIWCVRKNNSHVLSPMANLGNSCRNLYYLMGFSNIQLGCKQLNCHS